MIAKSRSMPNSLDSDSELSSPLSISSTSPLTRQICYIYKRFFISPQAKEAKKVTNSNKQNEWIFYAEFDSKAGGWRFHLDSVSRPKLVSHYLRLTYNTKDHIKLSGALSNDDGIEMDLKMNIDGLVGKLTIKGFFRNHTFPFTVPKVDADSKNL